MLAEKQLQAERERRELEYIKKLSENEALKARVRRLVIKLNDSVCISDVRFYGGLPHMLGYTDSEQYADDVKALWIYVGATLALDEDEQKKIAAEQ